MKQVASHSGIMNISIDWQAYYKECENVKSELMVCSKDLRFLQQLLDRYFDKMVQIGNLDEMRESLMLFQDVCYNCDCLKKKVEDQQKSLIGIIKGSPVYNQNTILDTQRNLKAKKSSFLSDFNIVKKEMYLIADHMIKVKKDNGNLSYQM